MEENNTYEVLDAIKYLVMELVSNRTPEENFNTIVSINNYMDDIVEYVRHVEIDRDRYKRIVELNNLQDTLVSE